MNKWSRAATVLAVGAVVALGAASPAQADRVVGISFSPTTSAEFVYGTGWYLQSLLDPGFGFEETFTAVDAASGEPFPAQLYVDNNNYAQRIVQFSSGIDTPPLAAGVYSINVKYTANDYNFAAGDGIPIPVYGTTPQPFQLTITPAAVDIELSVRADPNNSSNAIVAARMTGNFIDRLYPSEALGAPTAPAGTWTFTIADPDGGTPTVHTIEQAAGMVTTGSFYWTDVPRDAVYSATATFTPVPDSAGNFAFAPANEVSFTGPKSADQPAPTPTATAAPDSSGAIVDGPSLPLWSVIGIAAVLVALLVTAIIRVIRVRRRAPGAQATAAVESAE